MTEVKLIRRHKYILEKLASLKLTKLREILNTAPDELFKVIRLIFQQTTKYSRVSNQDIKALVQAKVRSFRKFLIAVLPLIQKL